jgi:hypothetical protein
MQKLSRSKLLKRNINMKMYLNLIRPAVTSASQTWTSRADKNGLRIYERQILRKIFGSLGTGKNTRKIRCNAELDR